MTRIGILAATLLFTATAMARKKDTTANDLRITGDGQEQTVHCAGNAVHILGNGGRFVVEGTCSTVTVEGSRNWVEVQYAEWIRTPGTLNTVFYLNPGTHVVDLGKGNSVSAKWQQ